MARLRTGALLLLLAVACAAASVAPCAAKAAEEYRKEGDVIILTDDNFDRATATGTWLIDIFAPWCSHCQQLEPVWSALATEMKAHNVKVAKIDGMQNRVAMKRFAVLGFPSLYLLKDGSTWQYNGMRTVPELKDFALEGHREAPRLPAHKAPNSSIGRVVGLVYSLPLYARHGYAWLKDDKGFSDTAIISGVLLLPLTFGAIFICLLDAMYTRQPPPGFEDSHEHDE